MKKLSIEQKAHRYDEAIKIAKDSFTYPDYPGFIRADVVFPELKESEDERIRKALISFVRGMLACHDKPNAERDEKYESWIAWLEKQAEQKPVVIIPKFRVGDEIKTSNEESLTITKIDEKGYWSEDLFICGFDEECIWDLVGQKHADKIEPKFKVGDWIIYKDDIWKICNISLGAYYELLKVDGEVIIRHFEGVDKTAHLWTIQDAKDGDILCTYECDEPKIVFSLKGTPKKHYALSYYCYYNIMYPHFESDSRKGCLAPNDEDVKPATKEQYDILIKAMADAGYTVDFENKELKKIVTPIFHIGDRVRYKEHSCDGVITEITDTYYMCGDAKLPISSQDELELVERNHVGEIKPKFKYGDRVRNKKSGLEQTLGSCIEDVYEGAYPFHIKDQDEWELVNQTWSEEDEYHRNIIIYCLNNESVGKSDKENAISWFKSLRPHWKPTDEHIEYLAKAIATLGDEGDCKTASILNDLRVELKKLKE